MERQGEGLEAGDGTPLLLRPVVPYDRGALHEAFLRLSPRWSCSCPRHPVIDRSPRG